MDLNSPVRVIAPNNGGIDLTSLSGGARLEIRNNQGGRVAELVSGIGVSVLALGGNEYFGSVFIKATNGQNVIHLNGRDQDIRLFNADGDQTILIDGQTGDIKLTGADTAEDFELVDPTAPAGSVMVIADDGRLAMSSRAYDRRVAGVISGAGHLTPGIVLGATDDGNHRPIALSGRVCCRVDATDAEISTGDLLTSSPTPGHAMRVTSNQGAFGAILGKALSSLSGGTGVIPILVALH